jgi:hypothetical protein
LGCLGAQLRSFALQATAKALAYSLSVSAVNAAGEDCRWPKCPVDGGPSDAFRFRRRATKIQPSLLQPQEAAESILPASKGFLRGRAKISGDRMGHSRYRTHSARGKRWINHECSY